MYTVCLNEYVISLLQCVYITSSQKCVCVDKMLCLDVTSLACAILSLILISLLTTPEQRMTLLLRYVSRFILVWGFFGKVKGPM